MNIPHKPWTKTKLPRRILAIRTQAMGDVMITLPYLQHLRRSLPAIRESLEQLRELARQLEEQPESMVYGRRPPQAKH